MTPLEHIETQVNGLLSNQDTMKADIRKILNYLHNDTGTGKKGLVAAFEIHESKMNKFVSDYVTEQKIKKSNMKLVSFIFGGMGAFCVWLVDLIFK